jgi:soluble lytic murein transglycosylase
LRLFAEKRRYKLVEVALAGGAIALYLLFARSLQAMSKEDINKLCIITGQKYDIEPALVKAIIKVESDFNPKAKNPSDPSYGLMQITPAVAYDYGVISSTRPTLSEVERMMIPSINVDMGARFLSYLGKRLSLSGQIQAYNVGYTGYLKGVRNYPYYEKVLKYYTIYLKEL